jgi:hypothetical protein
VGAANGRAALNLIEGGQAFDLNGASWHKAQASPR